MRLKPNKSLPDRKNYAVLGKGQCRLESMMAGRLAQDVMSSTIHGRSFYGLLNEIMMFKKTLVKIALLAGVSCFFFIHNCRFSLGRGY